MFCEQCERIYLNIIIDNYYLRVITTLSKVKRKKNLACLSLLLVYCTVPSPLFLGNCFRGTDFRYFVSHQFLFQLDVLKLQTRPWICVVFSPCCVSCTVLHDIVLYCTAQSVLSRLYCIRPLGFIDIWPSKWWYRFCTELYSMTTVKCQLPNLESSYYTVQLLIATLSTYKKLYCLHYTDCTVQQKFCSKTARLHKSAILTVHVTRLIGQI